MPPALRWDDLEGTEEIWPYGGSAVCVTGMRRKIRASRASPTACAVGVNHNPSTTCTAITTRLIVYFLTQTTIDRSIDA